MDDEDGENHFVDSGGDPATYQVGYNQQQLKFLNTSLEETLTLAADSANQDWKAGRFRLRDRQQSQRRSNHGKTPRLCSDVYGFIYFGFHQ